MGVMVPFFFPAVRPLRTLCGIVALEGRCTFVAPRLVPISSLIHLTTAEIYHTNISSNIKYKHILCILFKVIWITESNVCTIPVRPYVVIRWSFVRRSLVGRRAVAGVARLHAGGVALGLGGLTLRHQQFGGLALHRRTPRRCRWYSLAFSWRAYFSRSGRRYRRDSYQC